MARWTVDEAASPEAHEAAIATHGEAYVAAALDASRSAPVRARVLDAAMATLARKASRGGSSATQGASQAVAPGANVASVVAASLDAHIPTAALVRAARAAAEAMVQPILEKTLCLLAAVEVVGEAVDEGLDEEVLSLPGSGAETGGEGSGGESVGDEGEEGDEGAGIGLGKSKKRLMKQGDRREMLKKARTVGGTGVEKKRRGSSLEGSGPYFVDKFLIRMASLSAGGDRDGGAQLREDDVFVAKTAREVPLSSSALHAVLDSLMGRLAVCNVFELPAFIYQILLLVSVKGNAAAKRNVLRAAVMRFADMEAKVKNAAREASQAQCVDEDDVILSHHLSEGTLRKIQSTTLFHLDFAVKQDPTLISELTKLAKVAPDSPHSVMVPFGMAILLGLSRTPAVQLSVMSTIRDAVIRYDKEYRIRMENPFASRLCADDAPLRSPREALLRTVSSTPRDGWDLVSEPLLHLALLLMDKCAVPWSPTLSTSVTGMQSEAELGADILVELFDMHGPLRAEIFDQLISRVLLREKSSAIAIEVIGRIVRQSASFLLKQAAKVKESIADLVNLSPWTSSALIAAYKPLLQVRPDLRDYLFLSLRKALFHREAPSRAVAATGFLCLMQATSTSSTSEPSAALGVTKDSEDMMEETVQPLRRALTHPPAIRALMYKEISRMVGAMPSEGERSSFCRALYELLRSHMLEYVDASTSPFILLERCVDESTGGRLVEPLGDLIACLTTVEASIDVNKFSEGHIVLLAKYVATVGIRDFDISKDVRRVTGGDENDGAPDEDDGDDALADLATDTANRNRARVLGGVVEALLNAVLSMPSSAHSVNLYNETVFPLLHIREDVLKVLKELGALSAVDALRDLGGSVDIEPGSGRSIGWFGGGGRGGIVDKSGGKPKNGGKKKPGKKPRVSGDGDDEIGGNSSITFEASTRFGAFGILVSSSSCPAVSLETAAECLRSMLPAGSRRRLPAGTGGGQRAIADWFATHSKSKDAAALAAFLRAVAKTHVDAAIDAAIGRSSTRAVAMNRRERGALCRSLCILVDVAMSDFQFHRSQTGPNHVKSSVRSLELVETCISAVRSVYSADAEVATKLCATLVPEDRPNGNRSRDENVVKALDGSPILTAIKCLQQAVESLLEDGMLLEADVVVRILAALRQLFHEAFSDSSDGLEKFCSLSETMATWAQKVIDTRPEGEWQTHCLLVRRLCAIALDQRHNRTGLEFAEAVTRRIHDVLGDVEKTGQDDDGGEMPSDPDYSGPLALIHSGSVLQSVDAVLESVNHALDDIEWCLRRMTALEVALHSHQQVSSSSFAVNACGTAGENAALDKLERQSCKAEDQGQRRLIQVVAVLVNLLRTAIGKSSHQEGLLKATIRCYKSLSAAVSAQLRRRGEPRTSFLEMVKVGKDVGPALWDYTIIFDHNADGGDVAVGKSRTKKASASSASAMAAKEARLVPLLVYESEKFEKALIAVAKKVKAKLLVGLARNHARDVRIEVNELSESGSEESPAERGGQLSVDNLLRDDT